MDDLRKEQEIEPRVKPVGRPLLCVVCMRMAHWVIDGTSYCRDHAVEMAPVLTSDEHKMDATPPVKWHVGGSNDERHHWFLFYVGSEREVRYRGENGQPVRRDEGYIVYPTKKAATEALKRVNAQ